MNGLQEPKTLEKEEQKQQANSHHGMVSLAEKVKQIHTQPLPEATIPTPEPFPSLVRWGLGLGPLVGAALGLLFGYLLFNGLLVIPGWEGIFSLWPFTFHFFWTVAGAALGLLIGGIGTILAATPQPHEPDPSGPIPSNNTAQPDGRDTSTKK